MEQVRRPAGGDEYLSALSSVRAAKNIFLILVLLSLLMQLAAFAAVRWVGVIDQSTVVQDLIRAKRAARRGPTAPPSTEPATQEASTAPASAPAAHPPIVPPEHAQIWYATLAWVLPTAKFVALTAGMLLALSLLLAVNLALVGRTGGAGGFVSAFFWALVAWIFLIPWQQILVATLASGALYNLHDLVNATAKVTWHSKGVTLLQEVLFYVRFVGYPMVVLLVLLVVQAKFARGYQRMTLAVSQANLAQASSLSEKI